MIDGGTGQSPAVLYPTGASALLRSQYAEGPTSSRVPRRSYAAGGFNTNLRGEAERGSSRVDSIETGAIWQGLENYISRYLPAGGTATLIPDVGLTIRDEDRLNRTNVGYRRHDGKVAIPRFLDRLLMRLLPTTGSDKPTFVPVAETGKEGSIRGGSSSTQEPT